MDKLKMHSPNLTEGNIAKLAELFPNCVTEVVDENHGTYGTHGNDEKIYKAIDFDLLRQELSGAIVEGPQERYHLNWPGKREALLTANAPIARTLRPYREESVDFDTTQHLFIEGDNLDALKLLQETYLGKIKMIYIDPPYNTGKDFIYKDNFAENTEEYLKKSNQKDEEGNRLVANTDSNGRFHSDWLSMMYPRLKLARNLLKDDGVIFISIDDNEVHSLKKVCNEIYGEDNFVGIFTVNSTPNARDYGHIGKMHEYILFYVKDIESTKTNLIPDTNKRFSYKDENGDFNIHPLYNSNVAFHSGNRPNLFYPFYLYPNEKIANEFYKIGFEKKKGAVEIYPPLSQRGSVQFVWRWGKEKALTNLNTEIVGYQTSSGEYRIVQKMRHSAKLIRSLLLDTCYSTRRGTAEVESLFGKKIFPFPKPLELLKILVLAGLFPDEIVLDMFAGSSTTAHAVMQLNAEDGGNRKFIMVQLPEKCDEESEAYKAGYSSIAEISKERIRLAGKKITTEYTENAEKKKEDLFDSSSVCSVVPKLDTGFRVLKIDSSNMADVYYTPDAIDQPQIKLFNDNIKNDRTAEDLLFQVLLDWGVDLSLPVTKEIIADKEVFFVDGNALTACFVKNGGITEDFVKELAKRKPLRVVFRDAGFKDDSVKINVEQIFKLMSPHTEVKTI